MKKTKHKRRVVARKMILLHSRSGAYSDYTLQPNATDSAFAKMADECSNRSVIVSQVLVLPADAESYAKMVEEGARAIHANDARTRSGFFESWHKMVPSFQDNCRAGAKVMLASIGINNPKT